MAKVKQPTSDTIYRLKITLGGSKPPIWRRILTRADTTLSMLHNIIQIVMPWTDSHLHQFVIGARWGGLCASNPAFEMDGGPIRDVEALAAGLEKLGFDETLLERIEVVLWNPLDGEETTTPLARYLYGEASARESALLPLGELEILDESEITLQQVATREKSKFLYEYDFGDSWEHIITVEKIMPAEAGATYPVCVKGKLACPPDDCGGIWGYYRMLEVIRNPKHPDHEWQMEWLGGQIDPEAFDLDRINKALPNYLRSSPPPW